MLTTNCDIEELRNVSGIYYIINLITKRKYIGSSNNLYKRWHDHSKYSSNVDIRKDFKLYGINNFIFRVIDTYENIQKDELLTIEQEHLDNYFAQEYKNSNHVDERFRLLLYNYIPEANNPAGYIQWKEKSKQRLSERLKGEGNPNYGNRLNKEQRKRISDAVKNGFSNGRVNPNQGKKTSEEKKRNIIKGQMKGGKIKTIYSLNLDTKEVCAHESIKQCSRDTMIDAADIGRVCSGKQKYSKNYYFSKENISYPDTIIANIKKHLSERNEKMKKNYTVEDSLTGDIYTIRSIKDLLKFIGVNNMGNVYRQMKNNSLINKKYKVYFYDYKNK